MEKPDPKHNARAQSLAKQLQGDFPHIASAISTGLSSDPTIFMASLQDNRDVSTGFQGLYTTLEAYITHIVNTMAIEKGEFLTQIQSLETDIREKTGTLHALARSLE
jgi:hypothetical protein